MVTIAVIGLGHWGPNYVRNFSNLQNVTLKYACDINEDKCAKFKSQYPDCIFTSDISQILNDASVDAVCVATPTVTHYEIVKKALSAGKHVLVEKPITAESKDAEEIYELAVKNSCNLMVGHIFKYNNGIRRLKEYIDSSLIGNVMYIHSRRTNLGPIRNDVNCVWDLASHDISIFNYLLGALPESLSAKGQTYLGKQIDAAFITLRYPNKVMVNIHVSWLDPVKTRNITVIGDKKMLVFDDLNAMEPVRIYDKGVTIEQPYADFGEFKFLLRDGDISIPKLSLGEPLKTECQEFINSVSEKRIPFTDGKEGYEVIKILEACDESMQKDGAPIEISYKQFS